MFVLATALAACGGGDGGSDDPQTVLDSATLQGIESGVIDLSLAVKAEGKEGGDVDVSLSGPFQAAANEDERPQFDLTAKVNGSFNGQEIDFDGGLVLLTNSAYVGYQGTEYEVDPTTFGIVESALEEAQQGGSGGTTACQEAAGELEIGNFVDNLSDDGSADVGGTNTTKVSGDLDVPATIDALVELAEDPACSAQIGAAGALPSKADIEAAKDEIEGALKTAHADVYVGDDDIVRRISAQLTIEPPESSGSGPKSVELSFDLTLTGVNEEQEIAAPQGAKPLSDLFIKLGVNPIELLGLLQGEEDSGEALGNLLEGLSGSSGGSGGSGGGGRQAYLKCLGEASTPVDLQQCAKLAG